MNYNHPPPPPTPHINLHTTTQVLRQTTSLFTTNLPTFLFLSFLILTFRSNVDFGTHILTDFIDGDPTFKSVLSRADLYSIPHQHNHEHHRRRPFLQLTRVGTLEDDFFSGDDDNDRSLLGPLPKPQPNGTSFILNSFNPKLGFSNQVTDNGIRIAEIVRLGFSFKVPQPFSIDEEKIETDSSAEEEGESERLVDLQFFFTRLKLRHDVYAFLILGVILSASFICVLLDFIVTYALVIGILFYAIVNDLLGRYKSFTGTLWDGSNLGLKRLYGFIFMRWAVRDALTELLGICFFGEIEDQYSLFKILMRVKLMPFSIMPSWVSGYEREKAGFLLSWVLLDTLVAFIFSVGAWVAIGDSRKRGRAVVKEGFHLLSIMLNPAINIKCLEGIICGLFSKRILSVLFGKLFASAFQSVMEVYFLVAWLIYYFAARSKDATSLGRTFGRRELEGFLQGLR